MKNNKNNEKNVDQSTRSRSIVSRWAVRLLVLLVMITTILASFVVPASAADPFQGSLNLNLTYPPSFIQIGGSNFYTLPIGYSNNIISDTRIENGVYIIDRVDNVSGNLQVQIIYNIAQPLNNMFISSASVDFAVSLSNGESVTIPANNDLIEYISEFYPDYLNSDVRNINIRQNPFNGLRLVLNPSAYSTEYEGGIRSVFDVIANWIVSTFSQLSRIFFADGSLTVVGTLAVASLAVGVILLLLSIFSRFLRFGG